VKAVLPVISAGATFAVTALCGLLAGILLARTTGAPLWTAAGMFAGLLLGGYSAFRLLARSMR